MGVRCRAVKDPEFAPKSDRESGEPGWESEEADRESEKVDREGEESGRESEEPD